MFVHLSFSSFVGALALGFAIAATSAAHAQSAAGVPSAPPAQAKAAGGATAGASSASVGNLQVENGWMRATAPGQSVGSGYLTVANHGADDRLMGASSPASASVELHTMSMENNVMRMREVPSVNVPAGKTLELRPSGLHLMFIDLKSPLKAGETVPLKLRFEKAGEVAVSMRVEAMGAKGAGDAAHAGQAGHAAH